MEAVLEEIKMAKYPAYKDSGVEWIEEIPSHWEVKSEINCVAGGVEDKRRIVAGTENSERKLLLLEGNVFLGGIEIRNF